MSGLHAVRVAARLRRDLGIDVDTVRGHYGEYKVLVDGEAVVDGGPMSVLGLLPSARDVVAKVRARLTPDGPRSAMGA
ncbi:MAG TPA: hypothetical protein VFW03_07700 [Gemmatimonadaceae bacterium]|nr:hypothetical protein [Gemmatimonadaceae bacterium]